MIEIDLLRRLGDRLESDAPPRLAAVPFRDEQLAVFAAVDAGDFIGAALVAALLRPVLDDPLVLPRRFDRLAAFEDVVTARFFDVDVLARLAGPDRHQRVPVVRRGDGDGIEALVLQRLADVLKTLRRVARLLLDLRYASLVEPRIRIDQLRDANVFHSRVRVDVRTAPAVNAGDGDVDRVVRAADVGEGHRRVDRQRRAETGGGRFLDKGTSRKA